MNIPVISYIFLKGKCGFCNKTISIRYPAIEIIVGTASFMLFPSHQLSLDLIVHYLFYFSIFCVFLAHFIIDLEFQILPDELNVYLLLIMLVYSFLNFSFSHWIIGGLIGFLVPYGITWAFYKFRGQIGMGGGDIKLFGVLGIYLGPQGIIYNIFFSCFLGSLVGGAYILIARKEKNHAFAFGPYILIVAFIQIFLPYFFDQVLRLIF